MKKKIILIVLIILLIIFGISYVKEKKFETNIDDENSLLDNENLQKEFAIDGRNLFNENEDTVLYLNVILGDEETMKATGEYAYKNVTITDRNIINILMEKINNAKIYEPQSFIPEFGDPPPTVEIYYSNGEKCSIFAGDEIDDNGEIVNLFAKWNSDDGDDKTIYKVNEKMAEYIEKIYEEEFAKETLQKYETLLPYQAKEVGAMPYLLAELGLDTKENLDKIIEDDENKSEYIKTNTKYTDFKNEMLKYVTEKLFDKEYSHYIDMDGYVGIQDVAYSWIPITVLKVELTSKNENEYTFNATIRDDEMFEHYINRFENIEESDCYFEIAVNCKYVNGYLVVDKYDYLKIPLDEFDKIGYERGIQLSKIIE